jgi:hypothetical protein
MKSKRAVFLLVIIVLSVFPILHFTVKEAYGSIAYVDAASTSGVSTSAVSMTVTVTGANTAVFVGVSWMLSSSTYSNVTIGGYPATLIRRDTTARAMELWYKVNPASGLIGIMFGSVADVVAGAVSYSGVAQTGAIDASSYNSSSTYNEAVGSITLGGANEWTLQHICSNASSDGKGQNGQTNRWQRGVNDGPYTLSNQGWDKAESASGTKKYWFNFTVATSWGFQIVAFKAASPGFSLTDTLNLQGVVSQVGSYARQVSDALTLTDKIVPMANRFASDVLSLSDKIGTNRLFSSMSATLGLSDKVSASGGRIFTIPDVLSLSDKLSAQSVAWNLAFTAEDSAGNVLPSSLTTVAWTFPNGTTKCTVGQSSFTFKVTGGTNFYRVKYCDVWVTANTTINVQDRNVTSLYVITKTYPFTLNGQTYHLASNATIPSYYMDSPTPRLHVSFSGALANYTLNVDAPEPTYVLNASYDLASDYTTYLRLRHYANENVIVGYDGWGGFYVRSTQNPLGDVSWNGAKCTVVISAVMGQTGTLTVYCGSHGVPVGVSGLSSLIYSVDTNILSGTYTGSTTAVLDWTTPSTSGPSGGSTRQVQFSVEDTYLTVAQGQSATFTLNLTWTGTNTLTITAVTLTGNYTSWFSLAESLPKTLSKQTASGVGSGYISMKVGLPWSLNVGEYTVPVSVTVNQGGSISLEQSGTVYLTIIAGQAVASGSIPEYMTYILLAAIAAVSIYAFTRKRPY